MNCACEVIYTENAGPTVKLYIRNQYYQNSLIAIKPRAQTIVTDILYYMSKLVKRNNVDFNLVSFYMNYYIFS